MYLSLFKVVDQLFEKLDIDRDGRVSFENLLSLFQTGRTFSTSPPTFQGGQDTVSIFDIT